MKPGYKTTEFWTTIAIIISGILFVTGAISGDTKRNMDHTFSHAVESIFMLIALLAPLGTSLRYMAHRARVKIAEAQAEVEKASAEKAKLDQQRRVEARRRRRDKII